MIFTYKTTNLITGHIYIGVHKTDNIEQDEYIGSGKRLKRAINKYGRENFKREIIKIHDNLEEAYLEEAKLVNKEFVDREDTYNLNIGGDGGWYHTKGKCVVQDNAGNMLSVSVSDPRFLSGELISIHKGLIVVKDKDGNKFTVTKTDPRYLSRELVGVMSGRVLVKDSDGNTMSVSADDPKYMNGELVGHTYGMVTVKDKDGNTTQVSVDDPRYLNGELVHISLGTSFVINDPIQIKCPYCNKYGRPTNMKRWHFNHCKKNPDREDFSMLTCPYCNKTGTIANMKRWHFDNCKHK